MRKRRKIKAGLYYYDILILNRKGVWEDFIFDDSNLEYLINKLNWFGQKDRYKNRIFRVRMRIPYLTNKARLLNPPKVLFEGSPDEISRQYESMKNNRENEQ